MIILGTVATNITLTKAAVVVNKFDDCIVLSFGYCLL
jgi:hypothetical protein